MSCGCGSKIKVGITINDIIQDQELRETLADKKMISKQGFKNGDILAMMQYAACVDWNQLRNAFLNKGIDMERSEIATVAEVIRNGGDQRGDLTNANNQPIYFNGHELVRSIRFTEEQTLNSQCTIEFL